jgi:hypothetical protein
MIHVETLQPPSAKATLAAAVGCNVSTPRLEPANLSPLTARLLFPMDAVHRAGVNRFLDHFFGRAEGVEDLRKIVVVHPEHLRGGVYAELTADADILVNVRFLCHDSLPFQIT